MTQNPDVSSPADSLKVFISYSRSDRAFAEDLLAGIELLGFDAYLDTEDIAPGEPWHDRLGNLIRMADSVVFVMSPRALNSEHCAWELEETERLAKRIVPVVLEAVADADVPAPLRRLNYVFFPKERFSKGLSDVARALRADASWIREHTRYGGLATRWAERDRADALLLRANEVEDAKRWMALRPAGAPEISTTQLSFVEASAKAAERELAAKGRLRWRVQIATSIAAVVFAVLAYVVWMQSEAVRQTNADLQTARDNLASQNARLARRLALRAAPMGNQAYDVPAGWFQVATAYAGAVGFVERLAEPGQPYASGAIVNGKQLNPGWEDRPVLVTGSFVLPGADAPGSSVVARAEDAALTLYGPKGERNAVRLGKVIWRSEALNVAIASIEDRLPPGSDLIDRVNTESAAIVEARRLTLDDVNKLFDASGVLKVATGYRPIVFVGNRGGGRELTLSVSHLLGTVRADGKTAVDLVYTYVTSPGSSGSPIFDAETGDVIGIHLNGHFCPGAEPEGRRCYGSGASFRNIVAAIRGRNGN